MILLTLTTTTTTIFTNYNYFKIIGVNLYEVINFMILFTSIFPLHSSLQPPFSYQGGCHYSHQEITFWWTKLLRRVRLVVSSINEALRCRQQIYVQLWTIYRYHTLQSVYWLFLFKLWSSSYEQYKTGSVIWYWTFVVLFLVYRNLLFIREKIHIANCWHSRKISEVHHNKHFEQLDSCYVVTWYAD